MRYKNIGGNNIAFNPDMIVEVIDKPKTDKGF